MKEDNAEEDKVGVLGFSSSQIRGGLLLVPLVLILLGVVKLISHSQAEQSFLQLTDSVSVHKVTEVRKLYSNGDNLEGELFKFDPNTIDYQGLRKLGFSASEASGLIRYRTLYEKVFILPTDFAACYQVSDSMFNRLEPYINIELDPAMIKTKSNAVCEISSREQKLQTNVEFFDFDPNSLDSLGFMRLGFSSGQVRVILNFRRKLGRFSSKEQFGECYVVKDRYEQLLPYIHIESEQSEQEGLVSENADLNVGLVELNSATFEHLVAVRGIGELTAQRIIEYRVRLGGYARVEQLSEVEGVMKKNYESFIEYFFVKNDGISKIDINFADSEIMSKHPYMSGLIIRKVLKRKQLKGGLSTIEEMIEEEILTKAEADKLSDYLIFTHIQPN